MTPTRLFLASSPTSSIVGVSSGNSLNSIISTVNGQGIYIINNDDGDILHSWLFPSNTSFCCPAIVHVSSCRVIACIQNVVKSKVRGHHPPNSDDCNVIIKSWLLTDINGVEGESCLSLPVPLQVARLFSAPNGSLIIAFQNGCVGICDRGELDGFRLEDYSSSIISNIITSDIGKCGNTNFSVVASNDGHIRFRTLFLGCTNKPNIHFLSLFQLYLCFDNQGAVLLSVCISAMNDTIKMASVASDGYLRVYSLWNFPLNVENSPQAASLSSSLSVRLISKLDLKLNISIPSLFVPLCFINPTCVAVTSSVLPSIIIISADYGVIHSSHAIDLASGQSTNENNSKITTPPKRGKVSDNNVNNNNYDIRHILVLSDSNNIILLYSTSVYSLEFPVKSSLLNLDRLLGCQSRNHDHMMPIASQPLYPNINPPTLSISFDLQNLSHSLQNQTTEQLENLKIENLICTDEQEHNRIEMKAISIIRDPASSSDTVIKAFNGYMDYLGIRRQGQSSGVVASNDCAPRKKMSILFISTVLQRCIPSTNGQTCIWEPVTVLLKRRVVSARANGALALFDRLIEKKQTDLILLSLRRCSEISERGIAQCLRYGLRLMNEEGNRKLGIEMVNLSLSSVYNDLLIIPYFKLLNLSEVLLLFCHIESSIQEMVARTSEKGSEAISSGSMTGRSGMKATAGTPSLEQLLDWICIMTDCHFTIIVLSSEIRPKLLQLRQLCKEQLLGCQSMQTLQGSLSHVLQRRALPLQQIPDYGVEVLTL